MYIGDIIYILTFTLWVISSITLRQTAVVITKQSKEVMTYVGIAASCVAGNIYRGKRFQINDVNIELNFASTLSL